MKIKNHTALITGGSSGLGAATAKMVVSAGGNAVILDINQKTGKEFTDELGDNALFVKTDITQEEDVNNAIAAAKERYGDNCLRLRSNGLFKSIIVDEHGLSANINDNRLSADDLNDISGCRIGIIRHNDFIAGANTDSTQRRLKPYRAIANGQSILTAGVVFYYFFKFPRDWTFCQIAAFQDLADLCFYLFGDVWFN